MARRRDFVRGAQAIRTKRESTWFAFNPITYTRSGPSSAIILFSLSAAGLAERPFTIVRTRMELSLSSDQAAAQETQEIAVGIAIVSEQAHAIGVTAVPTPSTDDESDLWMLHQWVFADESRLVDNSKPQTHVSIDSKAMRKVDQGQQMVIVLETSAVSLGVAGVVGGRMLVKLH